MEQLVDALVWNSMTHFCSSVVVCGHSVTQCTMGKQAIVRISSHSVLCDTTAPYAHRVCFHVLDVWAHPSGNTSLWPQ